MHKWSVFYIAMFQASAVQASSSSDSDTSPEDCPTNDEESGFKVRLSFNTRYWLFYIIQRKGLIVYILIRKPSSKAELISSTYLANSNPTSSSRSGQAKLTPVPERASYPPENFCPRLREGSQQIPPSSRPNETQAFPMLAPNTSWSRRNGTSNLAESASPPSPLGNRSFHCPECGRAFYDGSRLRTHLRIHSGDLPYECGLCFKSFISKYRLDRHLLIHSGTRAFKCELCGQTFVTKDKLNRHHVTHTGERLGCDQCDKTFSRRDKLTRHRLTVHFPKTN